MFLVAKSRNRPFRLQVQPSLGLTYFQWSISDPHRFWGGSSTPETFHRSIRLQSMYTVDCKTPTGDRVISLSHVQYPRFILKTKHDHKFITITTIFL